MDYRNADGSIAEMCGNGVRVFARHLVDEGLADAGAAARDRHPRRRQELTVADDGLVTVDMGVPRVLGETKVSVGDRAWPALTSTWATRTPSRSSTTSPTPAR